jgi:hypothetical protein
VNIKNKSLILIITALPFYLNDFSNIFINAELPWLIIDYSLKLIPLCFIFYMVGKKVLNLKDLGLTPIPPIKFILWTIGITLLGLCLDEPGFALWSKILPFFKLGTIPIGPDSTFYTFDMTIGLMLVAIAEEIIFRGLAFTVLKEKGFSPAAIFILSGITFGLIHWSAGPVAIVATALTGTGLMICMWKTKSILPTIVAHYIINYLSFSGLASNFWGI